MSASPDTAPVRAGEQLDWAALETWLSPRLADVLPGAGGPLEVLQFPHGNANLTYLLRAGGHELVLRRPPMGEIAPGAHDMRREFKVLSRLWRHLDRAPRAYLLCDDHAVLGADFFVMERRRGEVVRDDIPEAMRAHPDVARRVSYALVDAMAELHALDPVKCDLGDLGKPDGFVERQVSGWAKRWALAKFEQSPPEMDALHARLAATMPPMTRASIVHNDLKLDNCQFDPANPDRVAAIFDWDMTTLGDPLVDLGTLLGYWPDPSDPPDVMRANKPGLARVGLPARAEIAARYVARAGAHPTSAPANESGSEPRPGSPGACASAGGLGRRSEPPMSSVSWWEAFALWKTAVVVQQLHRRWVRGESKDPRMATIADRLPSLIAAATRVLDSRE